jgi:hypothetical protein
VFGAVVLVEGSELIVVEFGAMVLVDGGLIDVEFHNDAVVLLAAELVGETEAVVVMGGKMEVDGTDDVG